MANDKLLDLYSDYLISAFGQTTATGLSALLNSEISHDSVQRFLAGGCRTGEGCSVSSQTISDDNKAANSFRQTTESNACQAGNKNHVI